MNDKKKIVMTREVILTLPKMREDGMTNKEIAEKLNVSVWTIGYWIKRLKTSGHQVPKPNYRGGISKIIL